LNKKVAFFAPSLEEDNPKIIPDGSLMGRTIPSFRIASVIEKEWKSFRSALDKSDRKIFDQMFSVAPLYNSASSNTVKPHMDTAPFSCAYYSNTIINL
jgi:hypothetical protein